MKGVICAGGNGTRLRPLTNVTNKHLLPVYNRPMIEYPLLYLKAMGITDIMLVTGKEYAGDFIDLLGNGSKYGLQLTYRVQEEAGGIAHAIALAEDFAGFEEIAVILGDNLFGELPPVTSFSGCAHFFLKDMITEEEAKRFGVAQFEGDKLVGIIEKPENPPSTYAVTGLYFYDDTVFDRIRELEPSARGELEITDVNRAYVEAGQATFSVVEGDWTDAGTFESLYHATVMARTSHLMQQP